MCPRAFEETGILKPRASFQDFLCLYSILGRTKIFTTEHCRVSSSEGQI